MYMTSDRRPWTSDLGTRTFDRGPRTTLPFVKVAPCVCVCEFVYVCVVLVLRSHFVPQA